MWRILAALLTPMLVAFAASAHTDVTPAEALGMILADDGLVVLDVREYSEFCGSVEHIEDAANLPWSSGVLQARFAELPADATILVVCHSGGRSHQAATFLDGQGFTSVYDMQGGMSAWEWETEACGPAPLVRLSRTPEGPEINWTPVHGQQDYDLIRGVVDNIVDAGTYVDLGPAECLSEASSFTYHTDPEPLEDLRFYLARQVQGSWGAASDDLPRVPTLLGCQDPPD